MKKTITKIIPEVKARPEKKTRKVVLFCDFCPNKTADHYGNERTCMRCGRDICRDHQTYDPDEIGDYGGQYCPTCIKLFKEKYRALWNELKDKHWDEEEKFWKVLKKESLDESIVS